MSDRQARRGVHNPVLALPAAREALAALGTAERAALRNVLIAIRDDARARAEESWRKHKGPMAVYWKTTGVICNHIARVLSSTPAALPLLEGRDESDECEGHMDDGRGCCRFCRQPL